MGIRSYDIGKSDYRVGSCYHCLVSIPVGSLLAWILVVVSIIGWGTSTWLGLSKSKELLQFIQSEEALTYEEIGIIAIALATVFITVVYLIIATFSSQKMSRYAFSTSAKNTFGYCLSITVIVFSFISVIFWTAVIALTMLPIAALSIIHILVKTQDIDCIHLQSYGIGVVTSYTGVMNSGNVSSTEIMANLTTSAPISSTSIGVMDNGTATMPTSSGLTCGDELMSWMDQAWLTMIPLLISFAFAVAVESSMLGFMIAASSNARHLRERMEYINEPYTYSSENINGNSKSANKDASNPGNNNQTDTQI